MDIINYIKGLLPRFKSSVVVENLELVQRQLRTVAIPSYTSAVSSFPGSYKFKSQDVQRLQATWKTSNGLGQGFMHSIMVDLKAVESCIDPLVTYSEANFTEDLVADGIGYKHASVLHFTDVLTFASTYSLALLNYIYIKETQAITGEDHREQSPAQVEYVVKNYFTFVKALQSIKEVSSDLEKRIDSIPDFVVTGSSELEAKKLAHGAAADPLRMGILPISINPIFAVRLMVAEYQAAKYHQAKEEQAMLQLRRLNLERINQQRPDPSIQRQIDYTNGRVAKLADEIRQMEDKYA